MKTLKLNIENIQILNEIQTALSKHESLTRDERDFLISFLTRIPSPKEFLSKNIPLNEIFEVNIWELKTLEVHLEKWIALFENIPGYDYSPCCLIVGNNAELLSKNVIMIATFAPSMSYNLQNDTGYEIHLKDDGTASYQLPTIRDAEQYPELYSFKGTWKEAYLLLIQTLQKGWPMEEFPEELQKFLPKQ